MVGALLILSTVASLYTTSNAALEGYCGMGRHCGEGFKCCDPMSGFCCAHHLQCCRQGHTTFCCNASNLRDSTRAPKHTIDERKFGRI
uniref:Cysteine rich secreted protein n=1 Tax=Riptortus pedestris TaxID=329032 RepID=R4WCP2_RIPPE|nr:cysteine rich secreted protein [Riptortus pedestris]